MSRKYNYINISYSDKEDLRILSGLLRDKGWKVHPKAFPWGPKTLKNDRINLKRDLEGYFINTRIDPDTDISNFIEAVNGSSLLLNLKAVPGKPRMLGTLQLNLIEISGGS